MFTRPTGGLCLVALTLTCASSPAFAKNWRELEAEYTAARKLVADPPEPRPGQTLKDEQKKALEEAKSALEKLPKELFEENAKKAAELLVEDLIHSSRAVAIAASKGLVAAKGRDSKVVVKIFEREKRAQIKRLLARVLIQLDDRGADSALIKEAKDNDTLTRAVLAEAIGDLGARATGAGETALRRLLRDDSLRVRYLAASALRKLGQQVDAYPAPTYHPLSGLPDHFWASKVTFLLDSTPVATEVAFEDPFAPQEAEGEQGEGEQGGGAQAPKKKGKGGKDEAKPAGPLRSAYELMGIQIVEALPRLEDASFHLARFGNGTNSYERGFASGGSKAVSGAKSWLERSPTLERDRRVGLALEAALELGSEEVYLFLCGPPTSRGGRDDTDEVVARAEELLWGSGVRLNVIRYIAPSKDTPRTEGERQAELDYANRFASFSGKLAGFGQGELRGVQLARRAAPTPEAEKKEDLGVDLTKAIDSRDQKKVEQAFRKALALDPATPEAELLVEQLAACPDPRFAFDLALEALLSDSPQLSAAAARGLVKNTDPRVLLALAKRFKSEKSAANQIRLLHAIGRAPGQAVTDGLVSAVETLPPDPARVAWSFLAERPAAELAEAKAKLQRRARDLTGLSRDYANICLARAADQAPPPRDGLKTGPGHFLPERFVENGVAFIIDTHKSAEDVFWAPPAPKLTEDKEPDKDKKGKRDKKDKKGEPEPAAKPPVAVLGAIQREVTRGLESLSRSRGRANVYLTGGHSWKPTAGDVAGALDDVKGFVNGVRTGNSRDLLKPIERALGDAAVERIVILVRGLPLRSPGSGDPRELADAVRKANAGRAVRIDVVYVLPPVDQNEPRVAAARKDELAALDAVYGPLAGQSGGELLVRTQLSGIEGPDGPR